MLTAERSPYVYDAMGRLQNDSQCPPTNCGGALFLPSYTYDPAGNISTQSAGLSTAVIYAPAGTLQFTFLYDGADRLSMVTSGLPQSTTYPSVLFSATTSNPAAYGPAGLQSAVLGRNTSSGQVTITETLTYDKRMRVLSKTDQSSSGTAYSFSIPSSGGYDAVGNLKSVNDTATGNWTYNFDTLNRLLTGSASSGSYAGYKGCWAYDPFANRTAETYQTSACPSNPTPTASYNTQNQVTWTSVNAAVNGFVYDAAGDVIDDNANAYVYDFDGRVCAVKNLTVGTMTQYVYDAEGHRVAKGTISSWPVPGATCSAPTSANGFTLISDSILDPGGNEVDQTNGINWMHTNIFVGGKLLATYGAATTFFALNDWLGTKRAEITPDGYRSTFFTLPYGNGFAMSGNAPDATAHHFTGKERDAETGLANGNDYFGARYYASSMGRLCRRIPSSLKRIDCSILNA